MKTIETGIDEAVIRGLIEEASSAREMAHAPYSGFKVGCAVLSESGEVFRGCNVEISSFSLTCCAERVALFNAVAQGARNFSAAAVVSSSKDLTPCGACRQALADFAPSLLLIMATPDGMHRTMTLDKLLPEPFGTEQFAE